MKRTFASGLILGVVAILPIAWGSAYWAMKGLQQARAEILLIEAHAHIKKNELNRAAAKLNQSIGAYPYEHFVHLALAELYERTGNRDIALGEYEIAKALCENCYSVDEKTSRLRRKTE
jgi:Tfp pilus assembly protein PilF